MKKKIVRHAKTKQVKKILSKKSIKKSSKWQFVVAAVALVTVGYLVFKNAVQKSDINMIAPPAFEPAPCGVSDLQLSVSCGENKFNTVSITCADGWVDKSNSTSTCSDPAGWYQLASLKCSNRCISSPSPLVSPSPSPQKSTQPSIAPSPAPSGCVYKVAPCYAAPCSKTLVCQAPVASPLATESVLPSPTPRPSLLK